MNISPVTPGVVPHVKHPHKPGKAATPPATPRVAAKDTDGDHDGDRAGKLDVKL